MINHRIKAMGKKGRSAQASMEFMMIVGFSMLLFMPVLLIYGTERESVIHNVNVNQVNEITRKIIDATETVYYMGEPSKMTIKAYIPRNVINVTITEHEIVFFVKFSNSISEVVGYSDVNMSGTISPDPGIHRIIVQSAGDTVEISSE